MKEFAKPILVLTIICIIASALLGMTYTVTDPLIKAAEVKATQEAMKKVLPGAVSFTELQDGAAAELIALTKEERTGLLLAAREESGLGYAFKVQDKGFGGAYTVMVGIGADGAITGAQLLDNQETPGLGTKTGNQDFLDRFLRKKAEDVDGVEKIVGATVSSNAFKRAVHSAYEAYEAVKEDV